MDVEEGKEVTPKVEDNEDMEEGLADWFSVDPKKVPSTEEHHDEPEDSVTEDDSDNADVRSDNEEEPDIDDWFQVKSANEAAPSKEVAGEHSVVRVILLGWCMQPLTRRSICRRTTMSRWVRATLRWNMIRNISSGICTSLWNLTEVNFFLTVVQMLLPGFFRERKQRRDGCQAV